MLYSFILCLFTLLHFHSPRGKSSSTSHTEHSASSKALQGTASAQMLGPGTYLLSAMYHHFLPLLSECKWKASWLSLAQRTVPGQQACLELAPETCGNFYLHHIQGLLSFPKCKVLSARRVLFTVLLSSKYHHAHHSLARTENLETSHTEKCPRTKPCSLCPLLIAQTVVLC